MKKSVFVTIIICAALWALAFFMRASVLNAQYRMHGADMPFTLESALQFRNVRIIHETGGLPDIDTRIGYPSGIRPAETDSIGAEYVYAAFARLFPDSIPLSNRARWISSAWFCLGIPLFFLWIAWQLNSRQAGFVAACFYAVAIAAVIRSTGQELSRENFAMPFLLAHLAAAAFARRYKDYFRTFTIASIVSGVFLGAAVAFWDLMQYYVMLWSVTQYVLCISGGLHSDKRRLTAWSANMAGLLAAGLLTPYLRAHYFLSSYVMLFNYGIFGAVLVNLFILRKSGTASMEQVVFRQKRIYLIAVAVIMPLLVVFAGHILSAGYGETYDHFTNLLVAKLKFLNRKPSDPALLTFDQRILWAPALNSANFLLTKKLFPTILLLSLIASVVLSFSAESKSNHETRQLLFYFAVSLLSFILFVRMHVFLVVFAAGLIGFMIRLLMNKAYWFRLTAGLVLMFCVVIEAANTLDNPEQWGRQLPYLDEQKELVEWLEAKTGQEPVLANFGLSAFIAGYADNPVILHPKFESYPARQRVREYAETLFKENEKRLRNWADAVGAAYLVYSNGEFADERVDLQMRYCVDAVNPPSDSAAMTLEFNHEKSRYFSCLWENRKYKVFRIITRLDETRAAGHVELAESFLLEGRNDDASAAASMALVYDPGNKRAVELIMETSGEKPDLQRIDVKQ